MASKRSAGRTTSGKFAPGHSGNKSGVRKAQPRGDDWGNYFTGLGIHGKDKRMGAEFHAAVLSFDQLKDLWLGDDLAARAVDTIPKEAMRQGYDLTISSSDNTENADLSEMSAEVLAKLELLGADEYIEVAAGYERGYGGGAVLIGANDGQTDLTKPLVLESIKSLDWLTPLEAREIMPLYAYGDPRAPKYGQPEIYQLMSRNVLPSYNANSIGSATMQIHESRLLIFPGIRVSRYQTQIARGGWGESVLTRVFRVLRDFNAAWAAAGVLVTDFAQSVIKIAGLWEALALDGAKAFENRLAAMEYGRSVTNAVTIDGADSYERQQTPLSGLPDLLEKFAVRLAAACDMPLTLLFGTSPSGMNATGESDIRFFYDRVAAYQNRKIQPALRRLIQIIFHTIGNKQEPPKWAIKFRPLWQDSAKDKAAAMLTQAQADVAWIGASVLSAEEVAQGHWGTGEYNPNISVDFAAREAQEQAAASPFTEDDKKALDPDYKPQPEPVIPPGSPLPPGSPNTPPGTNPSAPPPAGTPDPNTPPKARTQAEDSVDRLRASLHVDDFDEGAHPRDEHGRFGEGGSATQGHAAGLGVAGPLSKNPENGRALLDKAREQGGLTFDPETSGFPSKGYAVSVHPGHEVVVKGELTQKAIEDYLIAHETFFKENPGAHFGIWHDGEADRWYLDVSHVTNDYAEATRLATSHNQEAFYDLEKGQSVFVKDAGSRRIDGWRAWRGLDRGPAAGDAGADRRGRSSAAGPRAQETLDDFREEDHPRDEHGRFGSGGARPGAAGDVNHATAVAMRELANRYALTHPMEMPAATVREAAPAPDQKQALAALKAEPPSTKNITAKMDAFKDTDTMYRDPATGKWDPARERIHQAYSDHVINGVPHNDKPTVYMTGGGPASGKTSALLENPATKIPNAHLSAHVSADTAKDYIPEYNAAGKLATEAAARGEHADMRGAGFTHEESSFMAARATTTALQSKHDTVLDSTGDGGIDRLHAKVEGMRRDGAQRVVAHYATINVDEALRREEIRAKETNRKVNESFLRATHQAITTTALGAIQRGTFDELHVWDNSVKRGEPPVHVLSYTREGGLVVHDPVAFEAFKARGKSA